MRIINIQKNFVTKLPKGALELTKSPIGIIDCNSNLYNIVSKISDFKRNAIPVIDTYNKIVLKSGDKVIRMDFKAKNRIQLLWEKIFNPNKELIAENFIDVFNKTTIKYNTSTGKINFLEAITPRGIIRYILS